MLSTYRVRARNTSVDSENKIHDDAVAASFGFRGALVPGITIYAYMTAPIVERFGSGWLERGGMQVKFHQPFYDGEEVVVSGRIDASTKGRDKAESESVKVSITAARSDGTVCATALAAIDDPANLLGEPRIADHPEALLPELDSRPAPSRELLIPGTPLGTVTEKFELPDVALLDRLDERLPVYYGSQAVAHPFALLRLSNQILMSNFKLGPWIHTASDLINLSTVRNGEEVSVRGRVRECFDRKGHEFVVLDVLVFAGRDRLVQQVRHTAIFRPRSR